MFKIRKKTRAGEVQPMQDEQPNLAVLRSVARMLLNGSRFVLHWQQQLRELVSKLPAEERRRFEPLLMCEPRPTSEELAGLLEHAQRHALITDQEREQLLVGKPIDIDVPLLEMRF